MLWKVLTSLGCVIGKTIKLIVKNTVEYPFDLDIRKFPEEVRPKKPKP